MKQPSRIKALSFLLVIALIFSPVLGSINTNGTESKYRDNNPAHALSLEDVRGTLIIHLRAGGSAEDLTIFIAREGQNVSPIDNSYRHDGIIIERQNPDYLKVEILPDGKSEYIRLVPGNYTAFLRNGDAEQPEQQSFAIAAGQLTQISLLGHAVSMHHTRNCLCPLEALCPPNVTPFTGIRNCTEIYHPEVNHTVTHPATLHTITVVDVSSWNETIKTPAHFEYQMKEWGISGWIYLTDWQDGECLAGHPQEPTYLGEIWCHERTIPAVVIEITHPAVTHEIIVYDSEEWIETIIDRLGYWEEVCEAEA